jgi:hypothetical protein
VARFFVVLSGFYVFIFFLSGAPQRHYGCKFGRNLGTARGDVLTSGVLVSCDRENLSTSKVKPYVFSHWCNLTAAAKVTPVTIDFSR